VILIIAIAFYLKFEIYIIVPYKRFDMIDCDAVE